MADHTLTSNINKSDISNMTDKEILDLVKSDRLISIIYTPSEPAVTEFYKDKAKEALIEMMEYHKKQINEFEKDHIRNYISKYLGYYVKAKYVNLAIDELT